MNKIITIIIIIIIINSYSSRIVNSYSSRTCRIWADNLEIWAEIAIQNFFRPPQIVTFSLPTTPRKNFFRPPKFQHKKFAISFSLFGQT